MSDLRNLMDGESSDLVAVRNDTQALSSLVTSIGSALNMQVLNEEDELQNKQDRKKVF